MTSKSPKTDGRSLAQIESDLLNAETVFAEADARVVEAQRDRSAALDAINKHQMEIDGVLAGMRMGSTAGSKWNLEASEQPQILHPVDDDEGARSGRAKFEPGIHDFDRLDALVKPMGNGPILKISI